MSDDSNWQGNTSTILMCVWVFICPYISDFLTQEQFVSVGLVVIGLIIWLWNAYNPNTFKWLGNDKKAVESVVEDESDLINEEYYN